MDLILLVQVATTDLDKEVQKATTFIDKMIPKILDFGKLLLIALLVYIVSKKLIKMILKFMKHFFEKSSIDESVASFLNALIKVALNFILVVVIVGIFGIETTSIAALVGSAGLTVGLAFQGSLANFAGGVLILLMKPFRIGDYIVVFGEEGTVTSIDIFYTRLLTVDNRMVVLPNGNLSNANITNVTNEPIRRLDLTLSIDYSEDIKKVKDILLEIIKEEELVLKDKEILVFVSDFDKSAITLGLRVWVITDDYWMLKWDLLEKIKNNFDRNHIVIPYDQLDVNVTDNLRNKEVDISKQQERN